MTQRVTWRGVTLDKRTADMMTELARISGPIHINPTQGSFSGGVSASAGTHDGCGAVDLMHPSWSVADYDTVVGLARKIGFAAWHRTPQQSNWPRHCHLIAVQPGGKGDRGCLSSGAYSQVIDYYEGRNGLASRAPDDGPRQFVGMTWEKYQKDNQDWWDSMTPQERKQLIDDIAQETAARVNRTLGDYNAEGEPAGPNKDDPKLGSTYIRQIKRLVEKLGA